MTDFNLETLKSKQSIKIWQNIYLVLMFDCLKSRTRYSKLYIRRKKREKSLKHIWLTFNRQSLSNISSMKKKWQRKQTFMSYILKHESLLVTFTVNETVASWLSKQRRRKRRRKRNQKAIAVERGTQARRFCKKKQIKLCDIRERGKKKNLH